MPEIDIHIGGRVFQVACQTGEEHYLKSAAALLDNEAQALADAIGRVPETRMLLMAGLMLADKTAGQEEEMRSMKKKLDAAKSAKATPVHAPEPEKIEVRVEVPTLPDDLVQRFADMTRHAEDVAAEVVAAAAD